MNRRTLLRGLLALPVAAVVAKHLPAPAKPWVPWMGVGSSVGFQPSSSGLIGGGSYAWLEQGTYKIAMTYMSTSGRHYYAERTGIPVKAGAYDLMALGGFDLHGVVRTDAVAAIRTHDRWGTNIIGQNPDADANRARFFGGAA